MKKTHIIIIAVFLFPFIINAQENTFNYFLKGKTGTKTVLDYYTGSDKKLGQQINEITKSYTKDDTSFIILKTKLTGFGTLVTKSPVKYYNNVSYVELKHNLDVANFVDNGITTLNPQWLPYPADMQVGDTLTGYVMERDYGSHSIITKMVDRKVVAKETIVCPAGEFECLKITYTIKATTPQGVFTTGYTDWLNRDIGLVKQESTTGSGRLENYLILQSVEIVE